MSDSFDHERGLPDPSYNPLDYQTRIRRLKESKLPVGYSKIPKTVFFHPDPAIPPDARWIYTIIHTIANMDGFARCKNPYLIAKTGFSRRKVLRCLRILSDNRWIKIKGSTSQRRLIPLLKNNPQDSNGDSPS